jgi:hypothetical protein
MRNPSLQDFSLINQFVVRANADHKLGSGSHGFYYVLLGTLFDLQDDEIDQSITDDSYAVTKGGSPARDRGIDVIVIDEKIDPPQVHLLNCRYVTNIKKTRSFFPSNEIDKVLAFLGELMARDNTLLRGTTTNLRAKVTEIWDLFDKTNPTFSVHFCSNCTEGLITAEETRLQNSLKVYSNFSYEVHAQGSLALRLAGRDRRKISTKLKAVHKNLFEKAGGNIRALIVHIEAEQILRALCNDEKLRDDVNANRSALVGVSACEDAFNDNVRIYLQQRSKINRNIKATACSDENTRFFYFNNGITMTCDRFSYPTGRSAPIIEVENVQVVNGGQTIHALFDAAEHDVTRIEPIDILCRIYETTDADLSSKIAERTNTQTPVKTRDIQSIDIVQIKLEQEFKALGLYYERKRNQHAKEPKDKRVDAEKCGQVALAFYHEMPLEAKNKKQLIFGDLYENVFSEETNAHKLLLPLRLFGHIEQERARATPAAATWLRYASYHILYALKLLADQKKIPLEYSKLSKLLTLYSRAKAVVSRARTAEKKRAGDDYEDVLFFKSGSAKVLIQGRIR